MPIKPVGKSPRTNSQNHISSILIYLGFGLNVTRFRGIHRIFQLGIEIKGIHNTVIFKARTHWCHISPVCLKIQWGGVGEMYSCVHDREQKGKNWAMYVLKGGICWGVKGLCFGPLCW